MARIPKCDNCGNLHSVSNPVVTQRDRVYLESQGLTICIAIPSDFRNADLCQVCVDSIIQARFSDLCGMLAPYQPARVPGFVQLPVTAFPEEKLSQDERRAIKLLSRRLLEQS